MTRFAVAAGLFLGVIAVASADDAADALKALNGSYTVKSLAKGGMAAPDEALKDFKGMTLKDGVMTLSVGDKEETAKIKVDPSKKPGHIDISPTSGPEKGKTFPGLYSFEKGELKIVVVEEGDRPKDLDGKGEGVMTLVFSKKEDKKKE